MATNGSRSRSWCLVELTTTSKTGSTPVSASTRPLSSTWKHTTRNAKGKRKSITGGNTTNLGTWTTASDYQWMIKIVNSRKWLSKRSRWRLDLTYRRSKAMSLLKRNVNSSSTKRPNDSKHKPGRRNVWTSCETRRWGIWNAAPQTLMIWFRRAVSTRLWQSMSRRTTCRSNWIRTQSSKTTSRSAANNQMAAKSWLSLWKWCNVMVITRKCSERSVWHTRMIHRRLL